MVEQKSILMSVDGSIALLQRGITKFEEKNLTGCQIILYFNFIYLFCANQPTIGVTRGEGGAGYPSNSLGSQYYSSPSI